MKIKLSLIVAHTRNRVIGKDNKMLWHLPEDMKFFKNTTWGHIVLMGRKTFETLGKPLPGRINIITTRNKDYVPANKNDQTYVCHSFKDAVVLALRLRLDKQKIFVGGGGEIYDHALRQNEYPVNEIFATEIDAELDGDTFFPVIPTVWGDIYLKEPLSRYKQDDRHFADFSIVRYSR